jgi:hypothetical protein
MRTAVAAIALCGSLMIQASADDAQIDKQTRCAVAANAFDTEDMHIVRPVAYFIRNVFDELDAAHTSIGEPGIMANLNDSGVSNMGALVVSLCHQHLDATIYDEAALAYRGVRDMGIQPGVAK